MRYSFHLTIDKNKIDEYDERHNNVWEDLKTVIKEAGVRNYSIFRDCTEVFGYWECENLEQTINKINSSPIHAKWQVYMSDIILTPQDKRLSRPMKQVFRLD